MWVSDCESVPYYLHFTVNWNLETNDIHSIGWCAYYLRGTQFKRNGTYNNRFHWNKCFGLLETTSTDKCHERTITHTNIRSTTIYHIQSNEMYLTENPMGRCVYAYEAWITRVSSCCCYYCCCCPPPPCPNNRKFLLYIAYELIWYPLHNLHRIHQAPSTMLTTTTAMTTVRWASDKERFTYLYFFFLSHLMVHHYVLVLTCCEKVKYADNP